MYFKDFELNQEMFLLYVKFDCHHFILIFFHQMCLMIHPHNFTAKLSFGVLKGREFGTNISLVATQTGKGRLFS